MGSEVYANGRTISCKAADGKSICAFPDVCMTPPTPPAGFIPVPYPNTGMASDATNGSTTVKIAGKEVMLKNKSYFKKSTGDEAATRSTPMNLITHTITGKVYFTSWSMDVKVEGENVVRMADLTTHNHMSTPGGTPPWPYTDALAMDVAGHPCQAMAQDIKAKCSGGSDYSQGCCDARKCFLMPKEPNRCCNGPGGKQMTGHHLLPSKEFVAHANRGTKDPATNYVSDKAPCLCVEGHSHSKQKEHGQVGCNYTVERNKWLKENPGKTYTLAAGTEVGAKSAVGKVKVPAGSQGCDQACLQRQLTDGHSKMALTVGSNDPLPRAKQPGAGAPSLD